MADIPPVGRIQNPAYRLTVYLIKIPSAMGKKSFSLGKTAIMLWNFFTKDLWRVPKHEVKGIRNKLLNLLRTLFIAGRGYISDKLSVRASALTFNTVFAVVPVFAIIIAVGRGFGFQKMIENELTKIFPGQNNLLEMLFGFVQSYLDVASSGIVLGIGIVFIITSVWGILQSIETAVNDIFQVKRGRTITRRISDYLALMLIMPVMMILSSGLSVFINTAIAKNEFLSIISPFLNNIMTFVPYLISWFGFTMLYILIPNTKVHFNNALLAGFIAGFIFQAFQYLYISGQIWVNKYNAIYGSFAAIPLFLLWLQFSWTIVLFGAEIAYAAQNVQDFYFEKETKNVSHRYKYFLSMLIMNILCKRFEGGKGPITINEITSEYQLPFKLTTQIINWLQDVRLVTETTSFGKNDTPAYQPATDISKLTAGYMFEKLFENGSEDFDFDTDLLYSSQWKAIRKIESSVSGMSDDILIKDL